MSFLKSLFGGKSEQGSAATAASVDHKGFAIAATPYRDGGQWQLCGVVSKEIAGVRREHRFVRADKFQDKDEAVSRSLDKGRQLIDERGDKLFD